MIGQETREVERKVISILKILSESSEPMGAGLIASRLKDHGVCLGETTVRYHLLHLDGRGLTQHIGKKDGRLITQLGLNELQNALVSDRVGSAMTRIETLAYQISFEPEKKIGNVPINISLFPADNFNQALEVMSSIYSNRLYFSDLVAIAREGDKLGEITIPKGKVGLATISAIVISGIILRNGIPLNFKFAGVLQIKNRECTRFVDLINYNGSSLDPSDVFITSKMTSVNSVVREGNGKIIASFCEFPALAIPRVEAIITQLETTGITGLSKIGRTGETVCEIPVGMKSIGIILSEGLNLAAVAAEAGIEAKNYAMCGVMDFRELRRLKDLQNPEN
jgi:HTH-type transcriptional regulator, global nitrogen regulator NrpRI